MATTATVADSPCRYDDCDAAVPEGRRAADLKYCSEECYLRKKGEDLLSHIDRDHRVCATCYRQLAEVEYVERFTTKKSHGATRSPPDNYIGHKYHTPNTETVIDEFGRIGRASAIEGTRWGCGRCGNVDHKNRHAFIQALDGEATADRLFDRLTELFDRGAIDREPRRGPFDAGWADGGAALAVGQACYGR